MDGSSPPTPEELALLPHDSKGPTLLAVGWCLTALASIFLGLRIYCKFLGRRGLWWDDWTLIAAWVALIVDVSVASHMVAAYGYGRHSWDLFPELMAKGETDQFVLVTAVRATFTVTAIVWTKTAFAVTLLRLVDKPWMRWFLWWIIVSMNIFMGISALFFWVQCTPVQKSWTPSVDGTCLAPTVIAGISISSSAYSAAIDFTLALLPWKLIMGLQMRTKEKIGIGIAMSMGIIAGIAAIIKTVNLPKLNLETGDIYNATDLVIWDITEGALCMVAACIPVLRVLIKEVKSSAHRYYGGNRSQAQSQKPGTGPGWDASRNASAKEHPLGSTFLEISEASSNKSDESILGTHPPVSNRCIVRTNTFTVKNEATEGNNRLSRNSVHAHAYELRKLPAA